jgi:hypothetical protein
MAQPRFRTEGAGFIQESGTLMWHPFGDPSRVTNVPVTMMTLKSTASMSDVVGDRSRNQPCHHTKVALRKQRSPVGWHDVNEVILSEPYPIPFKPEYLATILTDAQASFESNEFFEFCSQAFMAHSEEVPDQLNGLNLLQDLLTLKGLLRQGISLFEKVISRLWKFRWYHGRENISFIRKHLSDGFLMTEFGIKPLISEVSGLVDLVAQFRTRLEFLRRTQGSSFPSHYRQVRDLSLSEVTYSTGGLPGLPQNWIARPLGGRVTRASSCKIANRLTGLDGIVGELRNAFGKLGLGRAATFAWDLVPFSFMVDWIFHIDRILDRYCSISPFQGQLVVEDVGCSNKVEADFDIIFHPCPEFGNAPQYLGTLTYSQYDRIAGLPAGMESVHLPGFTLKQLELLIAILNQRIRK